jgi:hypothetical protein
VITSMTRAGQNTGRAERTRGADTPVL